MHSEEQQLFRNGSSGTGLKYGSVEGAEVSDLVPLVAAYGQGISRLQTFCDKLRADVVAFTKMFKEFPVVQYSFAALLVTTLGKQALHVLLQYVSKRFGVSVAQVSPINCLHMNLQLNCLWSQGWFSFFNQSRGGLGSVHIDSSIRTACHDYGTESFKQSPGTAEHCFAHPWSHLHWYIVEYLGSYTRSVEQSPQVHLPARI